MPYRSARTATAKLTPEAGIVDDMVRQFADRHAFFRELIQNGIDAGATGIDVRVERSPDGVVRTSVEDDGSGMTRAIIEGPLLTLFESSKESDSTKIGKYGIGFVSVFATEPEHVDVRTRRANEAWLVRLFGDHSFELSSDAQRPGTGTEVTLVHTMTAEAFATYAELAKSALLRWCRHAHVPITFAMLDGYEAAAATKINLELSLPGAVTFSAVEGKERFVVAVGRQSAGNLESSPSFAGFYNRGLTLMETNVPEDGLRDIRFKVDSPSLSHTLSRDNVRRDDESRRVLDRVRALVDGPLWKELHTRIEQAASEAATGGWEEYAALIAAAMARPFSSNLETIAVPLVEPIDGKRTIVLSDLRDKLRIPMVPVADASTVLTRALAEVGQPVMRHSSLATLFRGIATDGVIAVEGAYALAGPVERSAPEDDALSAELTRLLRTAGRKLARARLAAFSGMASDGRFRVVATPTATALTVGDEAIVHDWGKSSTLFLNADASIVRLARRRAKSDVGVAAQLLCRAVLISDGPLAPKVVDRLLAAACAEGAEGAEGQSGDV